MDQQTLKTLRLIIPGMLVVIVFLPLFLKGLNPAQVGGTLFRFETLFSIGVVAGIGGLFYVVNLVIRRPFFQPQLIPIQENIKEKLLGFCANETLNPTARKHLREGRRLMTVFYHFVDNDESLKEKAKSIRLNGLVMSSIADLMFLLCMAIPVYLVAYWAFRRPHYVVMGLLCAGVNALCWPMIVTVRKRHIELSDEQLDHIGLYYREELCNTLRMILGDSRIGQNKQDSSNHPDTG